MSSGVVSANSIAALPVSSQVTFAPSVKPTIRPQVILRSSIGERRSSERVVVAERSEIVVEGHGASVRELDLAGDQNAVSDGSGRRARKQNFASFRVNNTGQ